MAKKADNKEKVAKTQQTKKTKVKKTKVEEPKKTDAAFVEKIQTLRELKTAIKSFITNEMKTQDRTSIDTPEELSEYIHLLRYDIRVAVDEAIQDYKYTDK